jgi:hypothetical protein
MSNKLWIFGDSFSETFDQGNAAHNWKTNYINFKGYKPKVFSEIVAEKLNLECINTNLNGDASDNPTILSRIIENIDNVNDGDVISVGWTTETRFRIVNFEHNDWNIINPISPVLDFPNISPRTFEEIGVNRTHSLYFNELCDWAKLVNRLFIKNKVIQWTWAIPRVMKFHSISDDTNGLLKDNHWSERGHQEFAEWFINCHNNNNCIDFFKKKVK